MPNRYENPLAGEPRTVETQAADGTPVYSVFPNELTPGRARVAVGLSGLVSLGLLAAVPVGLIAAAVTDGLEIAEVVAAAVATNRLARLAITRSLHRTTEIVMRIDAIAVRRRFGWKTFSRDVPHQFVLVPHDRTTAEQRNNTNAEKQDSLDRRAFPHPVFYGDSFHVALVYAGQRIDLLDVYGPTRATAVVARLQLCDELLNRAAGKEHRAGGGPGEDWGRPAPGGLA
jgi:hypothetical protein